jgi:signal transduction histidine kinase
MKSIRSSFFALWLVWLATGAQATLLTPESSQVNLLQGVQFLEDPSGQLGLEDVRTMNQHFRPWTQGGTEANFGFTRSAYWIRVPLQRTESAPVHWLLELHYAKLTELDFYPPYDPAILTGSARPFNSRPYFDRFFVLPVNLSTEPGYFYIRATSRYALTVPLTLWLPDAYRKAQQRLYALQFMYYGGLIVLAMYGLVIYLSLRDRRFLVYCAYIVTAGMGIFASNGYARQLLWPDAPAFDEVSQSFFLSLAAFFAVLFAHKLLLQTHERSWLSLGMRLSQMAFLMTSLLSLLHLLWPVLLRPSNQLLMLNSVVMGMLVSLAGIRAWLQKRQGIRFFIAGWVVLWLGVATATMRAFGLVPSNGVTSYAVQLSTVFEMVLMALALGDIVRLEHEAHIEAQAQSLSTQQTLLEISQSAEETLRNAVQERTEQLETSLRLEKNLREQYVRFGSMISHEFRTPLSIIQSQASLMRKEHEKGIDQVDKRLEAIGSATQRMKVMFDKWLHSDAISQTLEVLEPKPLELNPWLRTLVQTNPHLLLNHEVALQLAPQVGSVLADEYHLGVALTNLIDNAAKYSPAHSTIAIETRTQPGFIGIAVTDQGPGIPPEVQDKVFGEFFRLAPESQIRGVGLGLSIVNRIARAHGGLVELTSTPGHGATFCIWLPAADMKETA